MANSVINQTFMFFIGFSCLIGVCWCDRNEHLYNTEMGKGITQPDVSRRSTKSIFAAKTENSDLLRSMFFAEKHKEMKKGPSERKDAIPIKIPSSGNSQELKHFSQLNEKKWNSRRSNLDDSDTYVRLLEGYPYCDGPLDDVQNPAAPSPGKSSCCKLCVKTGGIIIADCRHCDLRNHIPDNLDSNIAVLWLGWNNLTIEAFQPNVFARYANLRVLGLDHNNLTSLPNQIFDGLDYLLILNLYDNRIKMDESLRKSDVFRPLNGSLTHLSLNRNNPNPSDPALSYPDEALSMLSHLKELAVDGLKDKDFGHGFSKLKNLQKLKLCGFKTGYCHLNSLNATTFSNLNSLQILNISDCGINGSLVSRAAFEPLQQLETLDMSNNFDLGIEAVGDFMYSFRNNTNFKNIYLMRITQRFQPCIIIYKHTLRHFKKTLLQYIDIVDNDIEMIEMGALQKLPHTLNAINMTGNQLSFGAYWQDLYVMKNLKHLYINGKAESYRFPEFFPSAKFHCGRRHPSASSYTDDDNETSEEEKSKYSQEPQSDEFILRLPPQLEEVTMTGYHLQYYVQNITFSPKNQLKTVYLNGNTLNNIVGPIKGLDTLLHLNLADCYIRYISPHAFDNFGSLINLNLFQNLLGQSIGTDEKGEIFENLKNLQYLNISFNNIFLFYPSVFKNLANLSMLDASVNRISSFNVTISHMHNLSYLNLHDNNLPTLSEEVRRHITYLNMTKKIPFQLHMHYNPIACDCDNLPFLEWVIRTKVLGTNFTHYYCKYPTPGQPKFRVPDGYEEEVLKLRKKCAKNVVVFVAVSLGTAVVVFILIGILLYRFRWTLRYWFLAAKLKVTSRQNLSGHSFEYDVFVSYANEDEEFVLQEVFPKLNGEHNLTLKIHGDSFVAGSHIAENIYKAVRQCRKTLVIITRKMLGSFWCKYELQMARHEAISTNRRVLVFLLREDIPAAEMGVDIVSYVNTSTYVAYPKDPAYRDVFWKKLASDLKA